MAWHGEDFKVLIAAWLDSARSGGAWLGSARQGLKNFDAYFSDHSERVHEKIVGFGPKN